MPNRRHGGSSPRKQQLYQQHAEILRERRPLQIQTKLKKKVKELQKLHPDNEYQIQTVQNKEKKEIKIIKLIAGKRYKKSKEQRMKEKQERQKGN